MIGSLIASLLPWIVPIAGILIVVILQLPSTKPGTSTKPEGRDLREDRRS